MKAIEQLVKGKKKKVGNHRVEQEGNIRRFIYHETAICTADCLQKTFTTDNGGWGTQSTTRAINAYRRELKAQGYKEVE